MVSETKIFASGFITMINVLIWYYVLQTLMDDINNWYLAFFYALGCAIGTSSSICFFKVIEKNIKKYTKKYAFKLRDTIKVIK